MAKFHWILTKNKRKKKINWELGNQGLNQMNRTLKKQPTLIGLGRSLHTERSDLRDSCLTAWILDSGSTLVGMVTKMYT